MKIYDLSQPLNQDCSFWPFYPPFEVKYIKRKAEHGLGHRVFESQQLLQMPEMYAAIFAAGALGYCLNLLFQLVERRVVHWSGK